MIFFIRRRRNHFSYHFWPWTNSKKIYHILLLPSINLKKFFPLFFLCSAIWNFRKRHHKCHKRFLLNSNILVFISFIIYINFILKYLAPKFLKWYGKDYILQERKISNNVWKTAEIWQNWQSTLKTPDFSFLAIQCANWQLCFCEWECKFVFRNRSLHQLTRNSLFISFMKKRTNGRVTKSLSDRIPQCFSYRTTVCTQSHF